MWIFFREGACLLWLTRVSQESADPPMEPELVGNVPLQGSSGGSQPVLGAERGLEVHLFELFDPLDRPNKWGCPWAVHVFCFWGCLLVFRKHEQGGPYRETPCV